MAVREMWESLGAGEKKEKEPRREPMMTRKAGTDGQEGEARRGEVGQGSAHSRRGRSPALGHSGVESKKPSPLTSSCLW